MLTLAPHHAKMLASSAIAPEVIAAREYWTATRKAELAKLGFFPSQQHIPALVIPIYNVYGELALCHIRPDQPRTRDGKIVKYEFPAKSHMALDVPRLPQNHERLKDPRIPMWCTEGSKKVDALVSRDCCACGVIGVWNWRGRNGQGGTTALPDFEAIALNERRVFICFDSDVMVKPQVHQALERFAAFLKARHARVLYVYLPSGASGAKVGVDDFLAEGHDVDDLIALATTQLRPRSSTDDKAAPLPYSDYTNALALVRTYGDRLRYCYPWKSWLVWTGTHWRRDDSGTVMRHAKQIIKRLASQAANLDDDEAVKLLRHVKSSLATKTLKAMIESAQSEEPIPVQPEDLDVLQWLLNVRNGTLDLQTGTLQAHQQTDLLTKCLSIPYTREAQCPTWESFLWRIMGGTDPTQDSEDDSALLLETRQAADARAHRLIDFLQRAIGYTLTGQTREQCLFLLHGTGANGKSTFLEVLQALLEEYAQSTPSASLLAKDRHDGIPNDIARLRGARLVTAIEIGEGRRLNEELVKRLTGQDTVTARFLFAEFFDFTPEFKLFIACNHLPIIRGTDHAIWRRIRLIPFTVTIPDDEQDPDLSAKLKAELPGILAWAVQGCKDWLRQGLAPPEEVIAATKDYREAMDVFEGFLAEECFRVASAQATAADLYTAYERWCMANDVETLSKRAFGVRLSDSGFIRDKGTGGTRLWKGIGLPGKEEHDKRGGAS